MEREYGAYRMQRDAFQDRKRELEAFSTWLPPTSLLCWAFSLGKERRSLGIRGKENPATGGEVADFCLRKGNQPR